MGADEQDLLPQILARLGVSQESTRTFKFGGVVGKVAIIAIFGMAAAIGVAKYTAGLGQIACTASLLGTLGVTVLIIRWVLNYAEKHPVSATLEGAEVVLWQQQIMIAAKNLPEPQTSQIIPNPGGSPPQDNPAQGVEE